jgi:hypothetical protein
MAGTVAPAASTTVSAANQSPALAAYAGHCAVLGDHSRRSGVGHQPAAVLDEVRGQEPNQAR